MKHKIKNFIQKEYFYLIGLLLLAIACQTSAISATQATGTPQTPPGQGITSKAPATSERTCAKVTATETLNLRATANGVVIGTLYNGEVVTIADNTDPQWLLITIDSRAGFASAYYLEIVECEK